MNIFALDPDPWEAAASHYDKHVVKQVLETAQLLSTARHVLGCPTPGIYKPTHRNHPCALWVRETFGNYIWTFNLFDALLHEYEIRYEKAHKSGELWEALFPGPKLERALEGESSLTPFAVAMPDNVRLSDPVASYRNYYRSYKAHLWAYRSPRRPPEWNPEPQGIVQ